MVFYVILLPRSDYMENKINYYLEQKKILDNLDYIPKVLLHSCCAPCSTSCIDLLTKYMDITIYYYNPNIEPQEEYNKRKEEEIRLIKEFNNINKLDIIDCDYDNDLFHEMSKGLEDVKEGGARCFKCYKLRMLATAKKAKELGYDYFATTLTLSPLKNSQIINKIGYEIEDEVGIKYLCSDFKKNDGYKKSIEFSKQYNLYRQNYCGCIFSKKNNLEE